MSYVPRKSTGGSDHQPLKNISREIYDRPNKKFELLTQMKKEIFDAVAEYWKVRDGAADQSLAVPAVGSYDWKECLSKALCHVHVMLLRDMRTPFDGTRAEMLSSNSDTMSRLRVYARSTISRRVEVHIHRFYSAHQLTKTYEYQSIS